MRTTQRSRVILAAALSACVAPVALPAADESAAPPQPDRGLSLVSPVPGYALMAIAAVAAISVSLLPARRGKQD